MNFKRLLLTSKRIGQQLRHDPRTIALALLVPSLLMTILKYVFAHNQLVFNAVAPSILGIFPFTIMFIIASISMLRERTNGTLERLMTLPITKFELICGYAIAFGTLAALQAILASFITLHFLGVTVAGGEAHVLMLAIIAGVLGMGFGLFTSSLATSEFQAVQFLPAFVFPQLLVCGLFAPFEQMARPLQLLADVTPLSYLVAAMRTVVTSTNIPAHELLVIGVFFVFSVALATISLRKTN
jgi:ABC-2 type transport system permease protein